MTGSGGGAGQNATAASTSNIVTQAGSGGTSTGGDINAAGAEGGQGLVITAGSSGLGFVGGGGNSCYGVQLSSPFIISGANGLIIAGQPQIPGAGGSGSATADRSILNGQQGANGFIRIIQFYQ